MPYFPFENKNIFYNISGEGQPLLLLHGNTASSVMFESLIDKYSQDFQVIVIDFPGHGQSDRLERFEVDFWNYNAKACKQLLDFLALDKVSVIGASGGALVGINLALEYPERIQYLVADSFEGEILLNSYLNSLPNNREQGKNNDYAKSFWFNNHGDDWERIVDLDTEMLLNFSRLNKSFFNKPISALTVPTLITGSKQDEFCDHLDVIYSDLKKKNDMLEIHLFDKGNHPAMLSNANEFYQIVKREIISKE
ncbi:alpha/beta fold hydrolase [Marinilabilia rubra]|uniref:Alpha/beta hydrolase n=1 Tax=Marinilabilia rubra TaxID=2162893 RepID=A0A2U2BED0_9BACT|nr:alpha/beta hydrolase [Marinilabilia rubra]PWE01430.1 alpha/beta hydrolase [Marinilabilia rubra]